MRFNKLWIDELIKNDISANELADKITMAGLEVDSVEDVCGKFSGVVVGEVLTCVDHPDSDHLHVTTVNVGKEVLDIVCGAPNCRAGLKVACAVVGAELPGDFKIKPCKLRGVPSNGMLCSYKELGMKEESDGIIELPADAPVGKDLHKYMMLEDKAIEVDLTANRADCLSMVGLAREIGVLLNKKFKMPEILPVKETHYEGKGFTIDFSSCRSYCARLIKGVDLSKSSPLWMQERLRRCGIRSVDVVVDVTNYVMLELGVPLHAYDFSALKGNLEVRFAKEGETITLLNGVETKLRPDTLVVADEEGPAAIAGIYGGLRTGVKKDTVDVLLEGAYFEPSAIKNRAREYGLATEASHRFERGVDYGMISTAVERATALLLEFCGGEPGYLDSKFDTDLCACRKHIHVPFDLINSVIGVDIDQDFVLDALTRLGMEPVKKTATIKKSADGSEIPCNDNDEIVLRFDKKGHVIPEPEEDNVKIIKVPGVEVIAPTWRIDINIPVDVVEEVARIYGYNNIPNLNPVAPLRMVKTPENENRTYRLKCQLADNGYHEVVSYSFVEPKALATIKPDVEPLVIPSPISAEMSVMRTTLWTGLISTAVYNINRQMQNLKLFESGLTFIPDESAENGIRQEEMIGGLICGNTSDPSWNTPARQFDFFDLKGDVEQLLETTGFADEFSFVKCDITALHPGVSAAIVRNGETVGYLGLIHPSVEKKLGLKSHVFLFEIKMSALSIRAIPSYVEISKFPSISRDLAIVVDKSVNCADLISAVKKYGGKYMTNVSVFDLYEGENLPEGKKSLAFTMTLQAVEKTLEDTDINSAVDAVVNGLKDDFGALLRE